MSIFPRSLNRGTRSFGQILPSNMFVQAQLGTPLATRGGDYVLDPFAKRIR